MHSNYSKKSTNKCFKRCRELFCGDVELPK